MNFGTRTGNVQSEPSPQKAPSQQAVGVEESPAAKKARTGKRAGPAPKSALPSKPPPQPAGPAQEGNAPQPQTQVSSTPAKKQNAGAGIRGRPRQDKVAVADKQLQMLKAALLSNEMWFGSGRANNMKSFQRLHDDLKIG